MSADPDVPVPETVIANTDPLDLPFGSNINADDMVCLPDGTIVGLLITGGRDLIQQYIETITPAEPVAPPPGSAP